MGLRIFTLMAGCLALLTIGVGCDPVKAQGPDAALIDAFEPPTCTPNPCQNSGTCAIVDGAVQCTCPSGFSGDRCEMNIDECAVMPCLHNGICTDGVSSFTCQCVNGWGGTTCSTCVNANPYTKTFSTMANTTIATLDLDQVAITGSSNVAIRTVNGSGGLGIAGGRSDAYIDGSSEFARFAFDAAAGSISFYIGAAGDDDGDGVFAEWAIEAFGANDNSLGSINQTGTGNRDVSALFNNALIKSFIVRTRGDSIQIYELKFSGCF